MKAFKMILAGGVAATALVGAAPAAAQYYPQPYGGNVVGQVINQVLGGGYGGGYGYGVNSQAVIDQCARAVEARINRDYGYRYGGGYNPYGGYNGYNGYGSARVLGISSVERRSSGGLKVRGVATTNASMAGYGGYGGYGQYAQPMADMRFSCRTDSRGYITDIDLDRNSSSYGYNNYNGYSQYPYRRY